MFFDDWQSLGKTVLMGILAYVALVALLRISGKRTLSKMNAFDLVVTVALGSTLATIMTSRQTPLANGIAALATLILLQFVVARGAVRFSWFNRLIKSEPSLLYYRGEFLTEQLRKERVVKDEVLAAVRDKGLAHLDQTEAVVLETDGTFSVLKKPDKPNEENRDSTLQNVRFHRRETGCE